MSAPLGQFIAVFVGSGVGGVLRFAVARLTTRLAPTTWPSLWANLSATWAVNLLGSMALAALIGRQLQGSSLSPTIQLAVGTGMLGGFTTYSTFNAEVLKLWTTGRHGESIAYAAITTLSCLAAGALTWHWASR